MKPKVRIFLIPVALTLVIIGFISGKFILFGSMGLMLWVFSLLFYSHRKQRVRYWIQGYKNFLENNSNNEKLALKSVQQEFCSGQYADEKICSTDYHNIESLVEAIIKKEYKFERLLSSSAHSSDIQNIKGYLKEVEKLKKEIAIIRLEK